MIFCALQIRFCSEANVSLSVSLLFVLGECQIKWCTVVLMWIYSLGLLCGCGIYCVLLSSVLYLLYYRVSCRMGIIGQLPRKITWNCPICVLTINTNDGLTQRSHKRCSILPSWELDDKIVSWLDTPMALVRQGTLASNLFTLYPNCKHSTGDTSLPLSMLEWGLKTNLSLAALYPGQTGFLWQAAN